MRDLITDLLDVLALLLIAAGAGVAVVAWRIGAALAVAGLVVGAGSLWIARPPRAPGQRA